MNPLLEAQLEPVARRVRRRQLWLRWALVWAVAAGLGFGLLLLGRLTGWQSGWSAWVLGLGAVAGAAWVGVRLRSTPPDWRSVARQIERQHPDLHALLLTAVEQSSAADRTLHYLQQRVIEEAVRHGARHRWAETTRPAALSLARAVHGAALVLLVLVLVGLSRPGAGGPAPLLGGVRVTVSPGDTSLERGESLVVLARFQGPLPAQVDLLLGSSSGGERRIPLVKALADPVFGGTVPEVNESGVYRLEYQDRRTRDFTVTVFEYPRLERADARLVFPEYTALPPQRIEDTRRLSAVEGTRLDLDLALNKPVTAARLVARDQSAIALEVATNQAAVSLRQFELRASQTFDLQLVDAEGRTNRRPAQFVIEVQPNRRPELKLASPRGDVRPSALEELRFAGEVWDDFGLRAYGLTYTVAGQEPRTVELGKAVPGRARQSFVHLLALEDLGMQAEQLVAFHLWGEDIGPDGQPRRTAGDLFFAEVRPFEEIYRQGEGQDGQAGESGESGEPGAEGSPSARLAELQKQIVNATWRLMRDHPAPDPSPQFRKDAPVVRDSQAQALEQAEAAREEAGDPRSATLWSAVTREMEAALERLDAATNAPAALPPALAAEQSAYQALLRLQSREHEVARSRSRNQQQAGRNAEQFQRQLDQLDLTESESRYETQRQAAPQLSPQRREELQVLNRLQELARRQNDLNERLKELQTALAAAQTEAEREEIRRRLKRLREEEQQMLADVDELRQRMDRPENQARLSEESRRLDQARDQVQRASEALAQESVSQALASGSRAQQSLQELRDDLRQQSSSQFAEDLRLMRTAARDIERQQTNLAGQIEQLTDQKRKTLTDSAERQSLAERLAGQQARVTNLVEQAAEVSRQAEASEPLLSRQLYDTLRQFHQADGNSVRELQTELMRRGLLTYSLYERLQETAESAPNKALEATAEMLRQGYLPQAAQAEQRARSTLDTLTRGVERAASSVLGDDAEALRLADRTLEDLTDQVARESGQPGQPGETAPAEPPDASDRSDRPDASDRSDSPDLSDRSARSDPSAPSDRSASSSRGWAGLDRFLENNAQSNEGPITGGNFAPWSDAMREVEELLEFPELRTQVATAREQARRLRVEFRETHQKPDWAVVRSRIVDPLVEVRRQIAEELARRQPDNDLVPIDRDPIPPRFSDAVRRYYEQLGKAP